MARNVLPRQGKLITASGSAARASLRVNGVHAASSQHGSNGHLTAPGLQQGKGDLLPPGKLAEAQALRSLCDRFGQIEEGLQSERHQQAQRLQELLRESQSRGVATSCDAGSYQADVERAIMKASEVIRDFGMGSGASDQPKDRGTQQGPAGP